MLEPSRCSAVPALPGTRLCRAAPVGSGRCSAPSATPPYHPLAIRVDLFSNAGAALIEGEELRISPMVSLELEYLYEIGRIREKSLVITAYLEQRIGLKEMKGIDTPGQALDPERFAFLSDPLHKKSVLCP